MDWEDVLHSRRSIRLPGYDYSQPGSYAVTICTLDREELFGRIIDGQMCLNSYASIVLEEWLRSAEMRPTVSLDEFGIMPNHLHGIIVITNGGAHCLHPEHPPQPQAGAPRVRRSGGHKRGARSAPYNGLRPPCPPLWAGLNLQSRAGSTRCVA